MAQNGYVESLVGYRMAELALLRDLGTLSVDASGLWQEPSPEPPPHATVNPLEMKHERQ